MSPVEAVVRHQLGLMGGGFVPGASLAMSLAMIVVPSTWCGSLLIIAYGFAVAVPWGTLAEPSTAERCLPMTWAQLRRGRLALHLGIAATALPSLAAYMIRAGSGADVGWDCPLPAIVALALLIPLWPLLCTLMSPVTWRMGSWRTLLVAAVAACAIGAAFWLCALAAADGPVAAGCVGLVALALAPAACALGGGMEQGRARGTLGVPVETPPSPLAARLQRAVAEPLSLLPPTPRALLLGLWLRPTYLYVSIALPAFIGALCGGTVMVPLFAAIVLAFPRIERLHDATCGGLLPRRMGIIAMSLPTLLVFSLAYGSALALHPPQPMMWSLPIASVGMDADRRQSIESLQMSHAYPLRKSVQMADGSLISLDRWVQERAYQRAPTLDAMGVAKLLALRIERDDYALVDPARLITRDRLGETEVSMEPVRQDIARAQLMAHALQGLGCITLAALGLVLAVVTRRSQRKARTWLHVAGASLVFSLGCLLYIAWIAWDPPVHVPADGTFPIPRPSWCDASCSAAVGHPAATAAALIFATIVMYALAVYRAKWLPLVPDSKPRLG